MLGEGECFEIDTAYDSGSINDITTDDGKKFAIVDSAKDCQLSCQALSNCKLWEYKTSAKKCWRKSIKDENTSTSDGISGQQFCGLRYFGFVGLTINNNEKVI